ncbi:MAG: hypothetical protein J1G06_06505 [Oscillospiraceae bacterium]|nr:hypothetical protein [Oscillospiraceae bacterium]
MNTLKKLSQGITTAAKSVAGTAASAVPKIASNVVKSENPFTTSSKFTAAPIITDNVMLRENPFAASSKFTAAPKMTDNAMLRRNPFAKSSKTITAPKISDNTAQHKNPFETSNKSVSIVPKITANMTQRENPFTASDKILTPESINPFMRSEPQTFGASPEKLKEIAEKRKAEREAAAKKKKAAAEKRNSIIYSNNTDFLYEKEKKPEDFYKDYLEGQELRKYVRNGGIVPQRSRTLSEEAQKYIAEGIDSYKRGGLLLDNVSDVTFSKVEKAGYNPGIAKSALGPEDFIDEVTIHIDDGTEDGRKIQLRRGGTVYKEYLANFLDKDRKMVYFYLRGKGDYKGADEYLDRFYNQLDNAVMTGQFSKENAYTFAKEHPYLAKAARLFLGPMKTAEGLMTLGNQALGLGDDITNHYASNASAMIDQAERERIDNKFLQYVNDGANVILENAYTAPWMVIGGAGGKALNIETMKEAPSTLMRIASGVRNASMGAQVYGSETNREILNDTYGKQGSILSPAVKTGIQMMSFDFIRRGVSRVIGKIMPGNTGLQRFVAGEASKILSGAGINATQTALSEFADVIIRDKYSDFNQAYERNRSDGLSADEARTKAAYDTFVEPTYQSAIAGGLIEGITGAPNIAAEAISFSRYGTHLRNNDIDPIADGLKFGKDTDAYKNAVKLQKSKKVSDNQLGIQGLLNEIQANNDAIYAKKMAELTGTDIKVAPIDDADVDAQIEGNKITISDTAAEPFRELVKHETAHRVQELAPGNFERYIDSQRGENFDAAVEQHRRVYESKNMQANDFILQGEAAADMARNFIKDVNSIERIARLAERNPSMIDRAYNAMKDFKAKIKTRGGKNFVDSTTGNVYTYEELRKYEKLYEYAIARAARRKVRVGSGDIRSTFIKNSVWQSPRE